MNTIGIDNFYEESFVDNSVTHYTVDLKNKTFLIKINGGYLDKEEHDVLKDVEISISNWYSLRVFKRESNKVSEFKEIPDKFLTSILEFHYSKNEVKLVGLGYNCWIEWIFLRPDIRILGEYI